jgi:hypothetical protein
MTRDRPKRMAERGEVSVLIRMEIASEESEERGV